MDNSGECFFDHCAVYTVRLFVLVEIAVASVYPQRM